MRWTSLLAATVSHEYIARNKLPVGDSLTLVARLKYTSISYNHLLATCRTKSLERVCRKL